MTKDFNRKKQDNAARIRAEMLDSFDEELEEEIDDERLAHLLDDASDHPEVSTLKRSVYFKELFRLQRELVKLQDWIQSSGEKAVIIFEGRDAAGKGGVIKRITQRLNPRVCRVVALPAPSEREKGQWYFQRYVPHLPARGELVLFDAPGTALYIHDKDWLQLRRPSEQFLRRRAASRLGFRGVAGHRRLPLAALEASAGLHGLHMRPPVGANAQFQALSSEPAAIIVEIDGAQMFPFGCRAEESLDRGEFLGVPGI